MHVLEVRAVSKVFHDSDQPAVNAASFRVESGEIFGLLGPSGCGKTTTLRIIAGFEVPNQGSIFLRGADITQLPPEKRGIGFVFQDYALFPHLTVLKNVGFGLRHLNAGRRDQRSRELLSLVGLSDVEQRTPDQLSGGQQQRVSLARALAADPQLILLDEPFSNLDAGLRDATRRDVRYLLKQQGLNAILVTHDQEEALSFCDRLAVMHEGRIEQIGTPEEVYHHPATAFVASFLGRANLIEAQAHGDQADCALGSICIRPTTHGPVLLSLRPEHIVLTAAADADRNAATVVAREFRGHDVTYRVSFGDSSFIAHTEYVHSFAPGAKVNMSPREAAVVVRSPADSTPYMPIPTVSGT